jgi:SAM-dependent methyltransferase
MSVLSTPKTLYELEQFIIEKGCFSPEENARIFKKWFKFGPRRRAYEVIKKYKLDTASTIDIGCGYGNNQMFLGEGSYGVEIDKNFVQFCNSIGLPAYVRDVATSDLSDLPKVNNAIAWAVMEHVDSQHSFLRNIHSALNPEGKLFLYVPTIPFFIPNFLPKRFRKYWEGHLHGDHVNAYTARTLIFICERAGFETISCSPGLYGYLSWLNYVPGITNFFDGCLYVGKAIPDWKYPGGSTRN